MKKNDFIRAIAEKADASQVEVRRYLTAIEQVTMEAIAKEDSAPFAFGKIYGVTTPARNGRNPKTGESIVIPEKHGQPRYKASAKAKE